MATCSECRTYFPLEVDFDNKEIVCPACGHAQTNFTEGDIEEMKRVVVSQRKAAIVCLISFAVGVAAFMAFAVCSWTGQYEEDTLVSTGLPVLSALAAIVALVFGYMASAKRFICEF
jgi:p-aminobenzoyl-glutamate transporter AbgT